MELPSTVKGWSLVIGSMLLGAIGGYAYYYYIGCASGTCPISSNPYISTGYGALIGYFLSPRKKKSAAAGTPSPAQPAHPSSAEPSEPK